MEGQEIRGLMEAYSQVYETPEVLNEEVVEEDIEVLDEAPMTAFQAAGGQAKLDQLNKGRTGRQFRFQARDIEKQGQDNLYRAGGGDAAIAKGPTRNQNVRGGRTVKVPTLTRQDIINRGTVAAAKPAKPGTPPAPAKPGTTPTAAKPGTPPAPAKPGTTPTAAKPGTPPAPAKPGTPAAPAKPGNTATPKPTAPATAKPAPKPGTQAAGPESIKPKTPNPLMKDMPKGPGSMAAPTPAPKRFDIRDRDPRARANFDPRFDKKPINQSFDLFDLVKGHLLDEGYADSEEGAMVIMVNMSEAWRESILESHGVELDEAQRARENPEEYERSESRRQSKRERAMNDPHTGINSPAFAEFMRQQMGGKKKKS